MSKARRMRKKQPKTWVYALGVAAAALLILAAVLFLADGGNEPPVSTPSASDESSSVSEISSEAAESGSSVPDVTSAASSVPENSSVSETTSSESSSSVPVSSQEPYSGVTSETVDVNVSFPCVLAEGQLTVNSLFQSTVMNPDAGGAMGSDVASLEVKNTSGQYMEYAEIEAVLPDGTVLEFEIRDLPADKSVWVFERNNTEIKKNTVCSSVTCTVSFTADAPLMADKLAAEASGTAVTIRNLTGETLSDLSLGFHCLFEEDLYFGGAVYMYSIESISPGESVTLDVTECFLGTAQLVRAQTS